jgi:hypothetical protein
MAAEHHLPGGPFRLDRAPGHLWQGTEVLGWRVRPLAVLRYLVESPGRLVTKAEVRQHVWGGTHVSDTVLRVCSRAMRVALADPVDAPQYLQTVGRQGDQWLVAGDGVAVPLAVARPIVGVEEMHTAFSPGGVHPPGAVLPGPPCRQRPPRAPLPSRARVPAGPACRPPADRWDGREGGAGRAAGRWTGASRGGRRVPTSGTEV